MPLELEKLNERFARASAQEILEWAIDRYWPALVLSSSFQSQSIPLIHMIAQIEPGMPIFFLDTGYHFPETYAFKEQLRQQWRLNIIELGRDPATGHGSSCDGRPLYETDPEQCCYINKVKPLFSALQGMRAWITGIRREQTSERAKAELIERQPGGLIKINPLLCWTRQDISEYIRKHELPLHPLHAMGYRSIGCAPCTRPVHAGEDDRAGRWAGTGKHECGIHTGLFEKEQMRRL